MRPGAPAGVALLVAALAGATGCVSSRCMGLREVPVALRLEAGPAGAPHGAPQGSPQDGTQGAPHDGMQGAPHDGTQGGLTVHVVTSRHVPEAVAYAVPVDGHVTFSVPRRGLHCVQDYGLWSTSDDDPDGTVLLEVRRGEAVLVALTPRELRALPRDAEGFALLRLIR